MKRRIYLIGLSGTLFFFSACVTQKSRSDISTVGKLYHNTTAKYNGYFNANEIMMNTLLAIEQQHQDNYLNRLALFPYLELGNPKSIAPEMDKAIEKVTRVVALHPKSQWTDDCYLLVGQAQFLKKDYESAEQTLRFMVDEFDPDRPKSRKSKRANLMPSSSNTRATEAAQRAKERKESQKAREKASKEKTKQRKKAAKEKAKEREAYKKAVKRNKRRGLPAPKRPGTEASTSEKQKEEEAKRKAAEEEARKKEEEKKQKPPQNKLKHQPAYPEGVLWLAKTLIERGNEESALRLIYKLQSNPALSTDVSRQVWPVLAHLLLRKNQTAEAIPALEQAIALSNQKSEKARFSFVLAQLYQEAGEWQQASAAFQKVIAYSSSYPMEFRAQLNMILNNYRSGSEPIANTTQTLEKLLKEPKNAEYRDQIHFTLAEIALEGKDQALAIEQFQAAVQSSINNPTQKGEAYYQLAQLYLEAENFVPAKLYLDSTLNTFSPQDVRYRDIEKLRNNLTDIAKYILTINEQDSLLRLSYLSDEEKKALASQLRKAEDEKKLAELAAKQSAANNPLNTTSRQDFSAPLGQANLESTFFAYNERTLKRGERDFEQKWGDRALEDNWRRSERPSLSFDNNTPVADSEKNIPRSSLVLSPEELEQIFANVPKTEAERRLAEFKISEAMYKLGSAYRERINNNQQAVNVLEQLQKRFPSNNFELDTWFNLYLAYKNLGQEAKAQKYATLLLDKYPATKYAQAIRNPNFKNEAVDKIAEINSYYDKTYAAFKAGNVQEAFDLCQNSRTKYGVDNPLLARFALLSTYCIGKLQGQEAYIQALNDLIAKYPNTDEQKQAREILRVLGGATATLPGNQQTPVDPDAESGGFKREDDQLHYILVFGDNAFDAENAKITISDYNRKFHKLDKLSLNSMIIGQDEGTRTSLIIIRRFDNRTTAMKYYEEVLSNKPEFISQGNFEILAISLNNYRELIRQQGISGYRKFFDENY